jgi:hypothetical protein
MAKHRIEQLTDRLAQRLEERIKQAALAMRSPEQRPPFTQRLTEMEQLEQYFAMDGDKWQQLVQTQGLQDTLRYSHAMQRLVAKHYGPADPTVVWQNANEASFSGGPEPLDGRAGMAGMAGMAGPGAVGGADGASAGPFGPSGQPGLSASMPSGNSQMGNPQDNPVLHQVLSSIGVDPNVLRG